MSQVPNLLIGSTDIVVIGSGAGGGYALRRLVESIGAPGGLPAATKVVLLESGKDWPTAADIRADFSQSYNDEVTRQDWVFVVPPEATAYTSFPGGDTLYLQNGTSAMGQGVGGATTHNYGQMLRMEPEDCDEWNAMLRMTETAVPGISIWDGSVTVIGVGTNFGVDVIAGDWIRLKPAGNKFEVTAIVSPTELTLTNPYGYTIASGVGVAGKIIATPPSVSTFLWNGTTTVAVAVGGTTEIAVGDWVSTTVAGDAPFLITAIVPGVSFTITNPHGVTIPGPAVISALDFHTRWNRFAVLSQFVAIENDYDATATGNPYGMDLTSHGGTVGTLDANDWQRIGRIGGAGFGTDGESRATDYATGAAAPVTPGVGRLAADQVASQVSLATSVLATPVIDSPAPWSFIVDRNAWPTDMSVDPSSQTWKFPFSFMGLDSLGNPQAGGTLIPINHAYNKYNEKQSSKVAAIDHVRSNPALTILPYCAVDRLTFTQVGGEMQVTSVIYQELQSDGTYVEHEIATKNVILAAGAINSPAILMRSGVGAAERLAPHDIPQVVDLPGVGDRVQNHPIAFAAWFMDPAVVNAFGSGYSAETAFLAYFGAWLRSVQVRSNKYAVSTSQSVVLYDTAHDLELFPAGFRGFTPGSPGWGLGNKQAQGGVTPAPFDRYDTDGRYVGLVLMVNHKPRSRGAGVFLQTRNATAEKATIFVGGTFTDPDAKDAEAMLDGANALNTKLVDPATGPSGLFGSGILSTLFDPSGDRVIPGVYNTFTGGPIPAPSALTDLVPQVGTEAHFCCSLQMGPSTDPLACCDEAGRLRGFSGIVVADASVMPSICRGNTSLTTQMIGYTMADMLVARGLVA